MKILLCVTYIGTDYHGWQVQPNGVTIQETLQDAIEKITGQRSDLTGCSRTDAGVHANNYYCAFTPCKKLDLFVLPKALNAVLPKDVAVKSAVEVDEDFHPRYNAKEKEYIYRIYNEYNRDPFEEGRSLHYKYGLSVEKMKAAAQYILGTHDFLCFCSAGSSVKDTVRTVSLLEVEENGSLITVRIRADGFLYNMVRIIVGTLIAVSEGTVDLNSIPEIIESRDRTKAGPTASPEGLYLNQVFY